MRTMFLVNVAAGRPYRTSLGRIEGMSRPPNDHNGVPYDSVVGEVGPALNYDEIVCYEDARYFFSDFSASTFCECSRSP